MEPEIIEQPKTDGNGDMHSNPEHQRHGHESNHQAEHPHTDHHTHASDAASPGPSGPGAASAGKVPIYKHLYVKVFLVFLIITLIMYWPITLNITSHVINGYGDVHQSLFNLWWVPYALFTLHQSPYFTHFLYYPIGANLATQTLSPIAALLVSPIYAASAALAYNVLFFSSFALSGLFMFMLAKYITKNDYAAFIAGMIFAFSPVHIAQSVAHLDWTIVEWIPAFILFYLMALREKNMKYAVLAALCFVLLSFMGDIQQGLLMFFTGMILTILLLIFEREEMLKTQTLKVFAVFVAAGLVLASPVLLLLIPHLNAGAFSVAQQNSAISSNMQWSDNLESYFLPSYYNGLFYGPAHSYLYIYTLTYQGVQYATNIGERVSYFGYSVLLLALIGVYYDYKKNKLRNSLIWIILFIIFFLLTLGPYIQVGSNVTGIPSLYMLFRDIPLLNIIREPDRMDFIVTICLAIIAALGFAHLVQDKDKKTSYKYMAAFAILIFIEYNGMPLSNAYITNSTANATIPSAYTQIGALQGNFSVLILPAISNASDTPNNFTGTQTYYVTAMKKPIIGGYTSRENATQSLDVSSIPLVEASTYLEQGYGLVYPSPITENYSNATMLFLADYNTAFVSVILSAYNPSERSQLEQYLVSVFGQPVYYSSNSSTIVFSTQQSVAKYAGKSLTAYTIGNSWIPGYAFCSPYQKCNTSVSSMWWGNNTRSIILYSPAEETVKMGLVATSPINRTVLSVYLNSNLAGQISLRPLQYPYQMNLTLSQGLNQIIFYAQNSTPQVEPYFAYGLRNITFTR